MSKYSVGIIGTGKIAGLLDSPGSRVVSSHAGACHFFSKKVQLKAACDSDPQSLKKFVKKWGVAESYSDVSELLDKNKLDIIVISSSTKTHADFIARILKHKNSPRIIFVEKPFCVNLEELSLIKKNQKGRKTKILVNQKYRFDPYMQLIRSYVAEKCWGDFIGARIVYYGGWMNNGVHCVDIYRYILQSEFSILKAARAPYHRNGDYCADVVLRSNKYPKAILTLESFDEKFYQIFDMELRFKTARLRMIDFGEKLYLDRAIGNYKGEVELLSQKEITKPKYQSSFQCIYAAMISFLDGEDKKAINTVSLEEIEPTMRLLWDVKKRIK